MSYGRIAARSTRATSHERAVADVVAVVVVDLLEAVEVHDHQRDLGLQALGARQLARQVHEQEARVRQAGQRIGQRVFLRLLEQHRVVDDRGRLLRHAVEQPAVIVAVERRRRCDRPTACR